LRQDYHISSYTHPYSCSWFEDNTTNTLSESFNKSSGAFFSSAFDRLCDEPGYSVTETMSEAFCCGTKTA